MKRRTMMGSILLIILSLFPRFIYADMGPKPTITIVIKNPPKGLYEIDLLMKDPARDEERKIDDYLSVERQQLMKEMLDYEDENGWKARSTDFMAKKHGNFEYHTYEFTYMGVPKDFKIIMVTEGGKMQVSKEMHRNFLQETYVYDFKTNNVTTYPMGIQYILQYASTCMPTLLIEGVILLLYRFKLKANLKVFLLTNMGTQLFLNMIMFAFLAENNILRGGILFVLLELLVMYVECQLYKKRLKGRTPSCCVRYGVVANSVSALAGFLSLEYLVKLANRFFVL